MFKPKNIFLVLLLLAATTVAFEWVQSAHSRSLVELTYRIGQSRYSIHGSRGSVVLARWPKSLTDSQGAQALACAQEISNDGTLWVVYIHFRAQGFEVRRPDEPIFRYSGRRRDELAEMPTSSKMAPLLEALDDPHRYLAAHYFLSRQFKLDYVSEISQAGDVLSLRYNGLNVELSPLKASDYSRANSQAGKWVRCIGEPAVKIPAGQLQRIRRLWHDRLDEHVRSIPYWPFIVTLLAYPMFRGWRHFMALRAFRRGLCSRCGYDLRATRDRCPECGAALPVSAISPASPAKN